MIFFQNTTQNITYKISYKCFKKNKFMFVEDKMLCCKFLIGLHSLQL